MSRLQKNYSSYSYKYIHKKKKIRKKNWLQSKNCSSHENQSVNFKNLTIFFVWVQFEIENQN